MRGLLSTWTVQEFSDAEISLDGKSAGRMEQTIIKSDGNLYINEQFAATLPPGSPQIGKEDTCWGFSIQLP